MSTWILAIAEQLLAPAVIPGLIAGLLTLAFRHLQQRDLERHKAELQAQLQAEVQDKLEEKKAQLQAEVEEMKAQLHLELQTQVFEFQTRFSLFHETRAKAILELQGMLTDAHGEMQGVVHPVSYAGDEELAKQLSAVTNKFNGLVGYFYKHRVYLTPEECERVEVILQKMREAWVKYEIAKTHKFPAAANLWPEAWKSLSQEVPPLLSVLEHQFRLSLSVEPVREK